MTDHATSPASSRDRKRRTLLRWAARRAKRHGRAAPAARPAIASVTFDSGDSAPFRFGDSASTLIGLPEWRHFRTPGADVSWSLSPDRLTVRVAETFRVELVITPSRT